MSRGMKAFIVVKKGGNGETSEKSGKGGGKDTKMGS